MATPDPPDTPIIAEPLDCCFVCGITWRANCPSCQGASAAWSAPQDIGNVCVRAADCVALPWTETQIGNTIFWEATDCTSGGCSAADEGSPCPSPSDVPPPGYPATGSPCSSPPASITLTLPLVTVPVGCTGSGCSASGVLALSCSANQYTTTLASPGCTVGVTVSYTGGHWVIELMFNFSFPFFTQVLFYGPTDPFNPVGAYTFAGSNCVTLTDPGAASVS